MFKWDLAVRLFDSFSILRWTDFIRPIEFVEIEKHALKSVLTYIIGKEYESQSGEMLNWNEIVDDNILGLLAKIATCDIKAPVHAAIRKTGCKEKSDKNNEDKDNNAKLNEFILNSFYDSDKKFRYHKNTDVMPYEKFEAYLKKELNCNSGIEDRIAHFSHKFVTYREFDIISDLNKQLIDYNQVKSTVSDGINSEKILCGLEEKREYRILSNIFDVFGKYKQYQADGKHLEDTLFGLYSYFEKLRPQTRWSQTPRIPRTSVLGHSMYVAALSYFAFKELYPESYDNSLAYTFYAALFHDLPESLTRDIISPVKRGVENLKELLSEMEYQFVEEHILRIVNQKKWAQNFRDLLGVSANTDSDEKSRQTAKFKIDEFADRQNEKGENILGEMNSYMDKIAAFVEAKMSVILGVNSPELQKGIAYTQKTLLKQENYKCSLFFSDFFASIPHYQITSEF